MKIHDRKVCSTSGCDHYYDGPVHPSGYCILKRLVTFCPDAKQSPEYAEHKRKRHAKWFA